MKDIEHYYYKATLYGSFISYPCVIIILASLYFVIFKYQPCYLLAFTGWLGMFCYELRDRIDKYQIERQRAKERQNEEFVRAITGK